MAPNQSKPEDNNDESKKGSPPRRIWGLSWCSPDKPKEHGTWIDVGIVPLIIDALRDRMSFGARRLDGLVTQHDIHQQNYDELAHEQRKRHPRGIGFEGYCSRMDEERKKMKRLDRSIRRLKRDINAFKDELETMETMLNLFLAMNGLEESCKPGKKGNNGGNDRGNDGSGGVGGVGGGGGAPANIVSVQGLPLPCWITCKGKKGNNSGNDRGELRQKEKCDVFSFN